MQVPRCLARLLKHAALTSSPLLSHLHQRPPLLAAMSDAPHFKGVQDRYSGITVSSDEESVSSQDFEEMLQVSLSHWMEEKIRGVWFKVDIQHAEWVPVLAKHGFTYHHAKPEFVMMVRWLAVNEPNNIPRYAHNVVGVGAFVVNDEDELLVVRERFYTRPHWKLPGGYVELKEDLGTAAIREVKEETGVEAEFVSLVAFRHVHGATFDCSDMYFIVHLRPTTSQIVMCKKELVACQWMKLEEYLSHPWVNDMNKFFAQRFIESRKNDVQLEASSEFHPFLQRNITVYSISHKSKTDNESEKNKTGSDNFSSCNGEPKL
ncbi:uncharacterized protein LOC126984048 isoform X1 [Eriocheir sinensis]|uniref:uncharacterized protein LOC126984048 isoform X1 n=2 Tax=Eriocheir sinensis TaxID=95602 RepID=UPI0021C92648|nr:uncharacterized protein LOC126984048 isoform X1 [Eriocheir sinensis]